VGCFSLGAIVARAQLFLRISHERFSHGLVYAIIRESRPFGHIMLFVTYGYEQAFYKTYPFPQLRLR
jgi:hypothetical protein